MQHGDDLGRIAEEIANSVTHGVGLGLSLAGFAVLLILASDHGGTLHIVSCAIYGTTLVGLYAASTLYHSLHHPRMKHRLRIIDHCAIFLLIAGTSTPFLLINLEHSRLGWLLFSLVWLCALGGVIFKVHCFGRYPRLSTGLYLGMSWAILPAMRPLLETIPTAGFVWLLAGGIFYTAGVWFYANDGRIRFNHAIWHLLVLGGRACHYIAVLVSVLPKPPA